MRRFAILLILTALSLQAIIVPSVNASERAVTQLPNQQTFDKKSWDKYQKREHMVSDLRRIIAVGMTHHEVRELLGEPYPGPADITKAPDCLEKDTAESYALRLPDYSSNEKRRFVPMPSLDLIYHNGRVKIIHVGTCDVIANVLPPGVEIPDSE